jgi:pimeloyl-ACP methyl ester carboxylesterase
VEPRRLIAFFFSSFTALALATAPLAAQGAGEIVPLGIALEETAYPFTVRFLPLVLEGQDVRMAYMDVAPVGPANGRSVLLLHGKNFGGDFWEGTARTLTTAGYRVVIPDQVGFGKSAKPSIAYSFDLLAANTATLLDTLGIAKATVVGHSMGGMLATRFALKFPGRTEALVLVNPIGLESYAPALPVASLDRLYRDELANTDPAKIRAFYRKYVAVWNAALYEPFVGERTRVALSAEYPRWAMASALTYRMILEQPVRHEFPKVATRALLVIGQADRTVVAASYMTEAARAGLGNYPELGRAAERDIPGAKLVEIPGVGHLPPLEAPGPFRAALLDFLAGGANR